MLKTKNVFLDTESFVSNGYFSNDKLEKLAYYGRKGLIDIYLTEITRKEIKSNIEEDLNSAIHQINDFHKKFRKHGRILRNFKGFKEYLDLPKLNSKVDYQEITDSLDKFIDKGKVQIIEHSFMDVEPIFSKYFNKEKPFGSGKKKHEFPDAFVLQLIENWCKEKDKKAYIISADKDLKNYTSDRINTVKNIGEFLGFIYKQEIIEEEKFEWIERIFIAYQDKMADQIREHFETTIKDEFYSEINIKDVYLDHIEFFDFSIIEEGSNTFIIQFDVDVSFRIYLSYIDHSGSYYDIDEGDWLFSEMRDSELEFDDTITTEFEIEANFNERHQEDQDISINCIYTSVPNEETVNHYLIGR